MGDLAETIAIKQVFGAHAHKLAISSSKSMVGHMLGAAGAVEAIATALSLHHQRLHPTINLHNPDPECELDYIAEGQREQPVEYALSNSFGFGGTNATLILARHGDGSSA